MENSHLLNVNTTAFVIFLLTLSAVGILWTLSCSWLTGRKKRQRVANNRNVEDPALDKTSPMTSVKGRDSGAEQIIIFPINDLGQSLHLPTIVITPPTPLGTPVEVNSLRSDSSIGTAEDLILVNGDIVDGIDSPPAENITEAANGMPGKHGTTRDSTRNIPASGHSKGETNFALQEFSLTGGNFPPGQHSSACSGSEFTASYRIDDSPAIIVINGSHVNNNNDDSEDDFSLDENSPRPRLSSMEPGTQKPDFQLYDSKPS